MAEDDPRPIREIIPEVPEWLCDIIAKLHAKNPDDRFQSAKEVADVLADCETQLKEHAGVKDFTLIPGGMPACTQSGRMPFALTAGLHVINLLMVLSMLFGVTVIIAGIVVLLNRVNGTIAFVLLIAGLLALFIPALVRSQRDPGGGKLVPTRRSGRWKWAAAALAVVMLLSGVWFGRAAMLYVSNRGELEVEGDSTVGVIVLQDGEPVADWSETSFDRRIELPPGRYTLQARARSNFYVFTGWTMIDFNKLGGRGGGTTIESDPPRDLTLEVKRGRRLVVQPVMHKRPLADVQRDFDSEGLQGDWIAEKIEVQWKSLPEEDYRQFRLTFTGDKVRLTLPGGKVVEGTFSLDASRNPREIDIHGQNGWVRGLYSGGHTSLTICIGDISGSRPTGFGPTLDPTLKQMVVTLRRPSAAEKDGWVQLFNGKDLSGWEGAGAAELWLVDNGLLVGRWNTELLRTRRADFRNFHLRAEVQYDGTEFGALYFRAQSQPDHGVIGYSTDLMALPGGLSEIGKDAIKKLKEVTERPQLAPRVWFTMEVIAEDDRLKIKVNGQLVAEDRNAAFKQGIIGFQCMGGGQIRFRKIEIKELTASPKTAEQIASEEAAKLNGEWVVRRGRVDQESLAGEDIAEMKLYLKDGKFTLPIRDDSGYPWALTGVYTIDAAKKQLAFKFNHLPQNALPVTCTYRVEGDALVLDFPEPKAEDRVSGSTGPFAPAGASSPSTTSRRWASRCTAT